MITESVLEYKDGDIKVVRFNKPAKKNALDSFMYNQIKNILNEAANDINVSMLVITGTGDFYSSGNDLTASINNLESINNIDILKDFIKAFIMFPKILIAIVNGPAIGIAATTLALCDLVFASEDSYFYTPFSKLGMVAEGCSTLTFPRLIGERKAAELLLYNHKMSATEALECGFVNYLYKPYELQTKVWDKIIEISKLPMHSLRETKKLIRSKIQDKLLETNEEEIKELHRIWSSGDYTKSWNAVNRKSKL